MRDPSEEIANTERAKLYAPVAADLVAMLDTDVVRILKGIMTATTDEQRRDIAADARATQRLARSIQQIIARGDEASRALEQLRNQ